MSRLLVILFFLLIPVTAQASCQYRAWLDPDQQDVARLATLLVSYPATEMVANPVSRLVNNARFDDPRCVEPLVEQEE